MPKQIEYKSVDASYQAKADAGVFSGLGAVFGNEDFGGDVIVKGAFDDTLTDWQSRNAKGQRMPILWQHDTDEPMGPWVDVKSVDAGLMAEGELLIETDPLAKRAHGLMKSGALTGLSIGYGVPKGGFEYDGEVRYLKRIKLYEISLVTFPMNDDARIDAVKAGDLTERDLERVLTRDARLSRSVARQLMKGGFSAIQAMQDAGKDAIDPAIANLVRERHRLLSKHLK